MAAKTTLRSIPVSLWVIPNGQPGELWTPHVFASEAAAVAYWREFWLPQESALPRTHRPVRATVTVTAKPEDPSHG